MWQKSKKEIIEKSQFKGHYSCKIWSESHCEVKGTKRADFAGISMREEDMKEGIFWEGEILNSVPISWRNKVKRKVYKMKVKVWLKNWLSLQVI